ncbi:MAG: hypothetical protein J5800_01160 [Spirochaetales bacterium]|nr:hypothetical protein [Spirochaetales bacterium]
MKNQYSLLEKLKKAIDNTMAFEASRFIEHPEYGWINTKIDAITGEDHFPDEGVRGRNTVYCWIQGRGLEALATHIAWYGKFNGYLNPDTESLKMLGSKLAFNLRNALNANGGHLFFTVDENGNGSRKTESYTLSDLFCYRGLYAWYSLLDEDKEDIRFAREGLVKVLKAVLDRDFVNDFIQDKDWAVPCGYHMLALGGATLLVKNEGDVKYVKLAKELMDFVLQNHVNTARRWKTLPKDIIVPVLRPDYEPAVKDGKVPIDCGNAIEFTGVAAQAILAIRRIKHLPGKIEDWLEAVSKRIPQIAKANIAFGLNRTYGIVGMKDGRTGDVINPNMTWWGVAEAVRSCFLSNELLGGNSQWFTGKGKLLLDSFSRYFLGASKCPIAVQTLGSDGKPVPVVPSTPDLDAGFHTGLSFIGAYDSIAPSCKLVLYKAEADITPKESQLLHGHAARNKPFEYVMDPLHCRVLVTKGPYSKSCLLSFDLVEIDEKWMDILIKRISKIAGIDETSIALAATHTHTGPFIRKDDKNWKYIRIMLKKTVDAAKLAMRGKGIEVSVKAAVARNDFGVNRRSRDPKTGEIIMRPNPKGTYERRIPVVSFVDSQGVMQAIIYNCSVHPTTLGVDIYAVSADYPGRIGIYLKKKFGESLLAIPITGCCGDVRPALLDGDGKRFRDGTEADVERIGKSTADAIVEALKDAVPCDSKASSAVISRRFDFSMNNIPTREDLVRIKKENSAKRAVALAAYEKLSDFEKAHDNPLWSVDMEKTWVNHFLKQSTIPDTVDGKLAIWILNDDVAAIFIPGELFSQIGIDLKRLWDGKLCILAGYSNGMLGYMPSKSAVREGGYEVEVGYRSDLHSGPFTEKLEDELTQGIKDLFDEYGEK